MTRPTSHHHPAPQLALAALATFAFVRPVVADEPSTVPATTTPAPSTTVATAPPDEATVATTSAIVDEPAPRYPRAVIARPLTLPGRVAMLGADTAGNHDLSAIGAAPIVGYGITDKLEVQAPYAFATRELEGKGSLAVDAGYAVIRGALGGKLEAVARVRGGYSLLDSAATPLMVGVHVQYNVTDWLAVISGTPGTQQLRISLAEDAEMARPVDFSLPLGVGVQAAPHLYLQLDTKLAQLAISDATTAVLLRDATPLTLSVVYNVLQALDVQAAIGTDLSNAPGEALTFLVGARFYAGEL